MALPLSMELKDLEALRSQVAARIKEVAARSWLPPALPALVGEVTQAQLDVLAQGLPHLTLPTPDMLATPDRLALGVPLLERGRFPWDHQATQGLFRTLCQILARQEGVAGEAGRLLESAMTDRPALEELPTLLAVEAVQAFIDEDQSYFETWAAHLPKAPRAVSFLAQASVTPSLIAVGLHLAPRVDLNLIDRPHAHCPICGSLPLMSCLQGKEGWRLLACSFCRTRYRAPRLGCTLCGETDPDKLGMLHGPEMAGYRIDYCTSCQGYMKCADMRERDGVFLPVLDDLDSLPLDMLAAQSGYRRATVSGLGF